MLYDCKITVGKWWKPRPDYDELWKPMLGHDLLKPAPFSDVVETVTSETKTWLKFRDETETLS